MNVVQGEPVLFSWIESLKTYLDETHPEAAEDEPVAEQQDDVSIEADADLARALQASQVLACTHAHSSRPLCSIRSLAG